jgi:hypothetical protein
MGPEARIGFHAAYNMEGQETGVGNALIGAYLNKIGLPYTAVIYITQASPDSITWLSVVEAEKRGIEVEVTSSQRVQNKTAASPPWGIPVGPAQGAQEGDIKPYPIPNGLFPRSSTIPAAPPPRKANEDSSSFAPVCQKIQREEIANAGQCIKDEFRRLVRNRTEAATVVADAIIGQCRTRFFYRMDLRSEPFQFCHNDQLNKVRENYFAEMRSNVLNLIVDFRTR